MALTEAGAVVETKAPKSVLTPPSTFLDLSRLGTRGFLFHLAGGMSTSTVPKPDTASAIKTLGKSRKWAKFKEALRLDKATSSCFGDDQEKQAPEAQALWKPPT